MRAREIFAGLGAWLGVNLVLVTAFAAVNTVNSGASVGFVGLLTLAVNIAVIVIAAAKGHKGFAVGFALGYVVAFVLFLGACFLLLAAMSGAEFG